MTKPDRNTGRPCTAGLLWSLVLLGIAGGRIASGAAAAGLDWQRGLGGRSALLQVPAAGRPGFSLLPPDTTGLAFTNWLAQDGFRRQDRELAMNPDVTEAQAARRRLLRLLPFTLALAALPLPAAERQSDWQPGRGFRWRELNVPANGRTFLERLPPAATGITFTNYISEDKGLENSLRTSGAGVAAGDIDGDGWCDLYF